MAALATDTPGPFLALGELSHIAPGTRYVLTLDSDTQLPPGRLREGLISVARVLFLGMSMDFIYQLRELDAFYPAEAAVIAILLAVIPYFIFRWIVEFVARRWLARHGNTLQ